MADSNKGKHESMDIGDRCRVEACSLPVTASNANSNNYKPLANNHVLGIIACTALSTLAPLRA